jgi:hypothetical protein
MSDNEAGAAIGIGVFVLAVALVFTFGGLATDRMRYESFLRAQAAVLECRANHINQPDHLCGPVPTFTDFK